MEELGDLLTPSQLKLLSKTLQVTSETSNIQNKNETQHYAQRINTEAHDNQSSIQGLCEQMKLRSSFIASFTAVEEDTEALKRVYQLHDVFTGLPREPVNIKHSVTEEISTTEQREVIIKGEEVRRGIWDREATKIQSSWRGMKCRSELMEHFEKRFKQQALHRHSPTKGMPESTQKATLLRAP